MIVNQTSCHCATAGGYDQGELTELNAGGIARIFKAMGHPSRLIILEALKDGQRCVCDLAALVPGELSTVSRHLMSLKNAGIITDRREGQRVYYRLTLTCVNSFTSCIADRIGKQDRYE